MTSWLSNRSLQGCLTKQLSCTLGDLFPGSYYRFRIRSVCKTGISQPSEPTERIFIGRPEEDEVFGLPGGNYPKEHQKQNNLFHYGIKSSKRFSSLGQDLGSNQSNEEPQIHQLPNNASQVKKDRQYSLERDVYYIGNRLVPKPITWKMNGIVLYVVVFSFIRGWIIHWKLPLWVIIDNRKAIARLSDFLCIFGTITVVVKHYIRV